RSRFLFPRKALRGPFSLRFNLTFRCTQHVPERMVRAHPSPPTSMSPVADAAALAASISLPGRPVAEALARRLVTAGADLSRCIVATFGPEHLLLFRYGPAPYLLIFQDRPGTYWVMNGDYDIPARFTEYPRFPPRAAGLSLEEGGEIINRHFPDN